MFDNMIFIICSKIHAPSRLRKRQVLKLHCKDVISLDFRIYQNTIAKNKKL